MCVGLQDCVARACRIRYVRPSGRWTASRCRKRECSARLSDFIANYKGITTHERISRHSFIAPSTLCLLWLSCSNPSVFLSQGRPRARTTNVFLHTKLYVQTLWIWWRMLRTLRCVITIGSPRQTLTKNNLRNGPRLHGSSGMPTAKHTLQAMRSRNAS